MRPPRGLSPSRPFLLRLLFLVLPALPHALILSAPERCGGTHVVTHATAFFGPKPGPSAVRDVPLFAPPAQAAGRHLAHILRPHPAPSPPPRSDHSVRPAWLLLAAVRNRLRTHFAHLASAHDYSADAGLGIGGQADTPPPWRRPPDPDTAPHPPDHDDPDHDQFRVWDVYRDAWLPSLTGHTDKPNLDARLVDTAAPATATDSTHLPPPSDRITTADSAMNSVSTDVLSQEPPVNTSVADHFSLFDACTQLSVPADLDAMTGRVAVVARGDCDFAQKVGLMQDAGAVGVIVVNFKDSGEHLANMKLNETKKKPDISIPAVMISYSDWVKILPCRNDTRVVFTAEGEATFDIDYGRDALNWAMMRGMALWILCQCGVNVVRYKRRVTEFRARADAIAALPVDTYSRPHSHREDSSHDASGEAPRQEDAASEFVLAPSVAGPAPASPVLDHDPERMRLLPSDSESTEMASSAGAAPSSASTALDDDGEDEEDPVCAVCLEDFETGQQVRLLACSHLYHQSCIDPWLQSSSNSCPLCKREVPNLPPPPTQLHYGSMNI